MAFFPSNFLLQTPTNQNEHPHFHVQGLAPIPGKRSMSFSEVCQEEATDGGGEEENLSDDGSLAGEKKRRLNMEQVRTLERNFELGNKLDPERKMQLAKALGLQPRQVAIWFQNRRARWKTKQLERDFDLLKKQFNSLKADNESLHAQNQKLQAELSILRGGEPTESINLNKETDQGSSSNRSENTEIKLDISTRTPTTAFESESPFSANQHQTTISSRVFFPPSSSSSSMINRPNIGPVAQLFQNPHTSRFDQPAKEESFHNVFCPMDDHSGFWPWIDQQNFN